jgi:hypothetical protein
MCDVVIWCLAFVVLADALKYEIWPWPLHLNLLTTRHKNSKNDWRSSLQLLESYDMLRKIGFLKLKKPCSLQIWKKNPLDLFEIYFTKFIKLLKFVNIFKVLS